MKEPQFSLWWDDQIGVLKEHRLTSVSERFEDLVETHADLSGTVYLASGDAIQEERSRFDLLAVNPLMQIRSYGTRIQVTFLSEEISFVDSPFAILRWILNHSSSATLYEHPCLSGLFGYLSYDFLHEIEDVPQTTRDLFVLPDLYLTIPQQLYIFDRWKKECIQVEPIFSKILPSTPLTVQSRMNHDYRTGACLRAFSSSKYEQDVREIKRRIALGEVYQVNLSQNVRYEFSGSAFSFFKELLRSNPTPFSSYIQAGDHQIISNSPERFLSCRNGVVHAQPIKGTRPRGKDGNQEIFWKDELLSDPKDDAELSMIVDLFRNDLSRVAQVGSVSVVKHKLIEEYSSLYHLSSIVKATLKSDADLVDLIKATFPSGSITGCPKIRAMEIIDELETLRRGIYTGAIGYIGFQSNMDLSVAIRTAMVAKDTLTYSVGAGIVYDSDAVKECQEVLVKGEPFQKLLMGPGHLLQCRKSSHSPKVVWSDGEFVPQDSLQVCVEEDFPFFGFGVFETIRVNYGSPLFLEEHLGRMKTSLLNLSQVVHFGFEELDRISWRSVITSLLKKNSLWNCVSKVRISFGMSHPRRPPHWIVTAVAYRHPLSEVNEQSGLTTKIFPKIHMSWLNEIKNHSYLHYRIARIWAQAQGCNEALLVDDRFHLIEGSCSSLLEVDVRDQKAYIPQSTHQLRSLSRERALRWLSQKGYTISKGDFGVSRIKEGTWKRELWLLNSLMGAVRVVSVDDVPIHCEETPTFLEDLNSALQTRPL